MKRKKILHSLKPGIIVFMIVVFWKSTTYAQSSNLGEDVTGSITQLLNILLSFLSRFWIWLASFAGKLMTNGFVYGEFMGLDRVLYYIWNLTRTLANFFLVGLLLFEVAKSVLGSQFNLRDIAKYVINLIVGAVLINASWFILGATVDLSTVLTTTAASLSNSYIASESGNLKDTMHSSMALARVAYRKKIALDTPINGNEKIVETEDSTDSMDSMDELLDKILPSETSISGPLLYLGIGVFELDNFFDSTLDNHSITKNLFVISTRLAIILAYSFAMILLVIVNIARIITIWFAAAFGPILMILRITGNDKLLSKLGSTGDKLGWKSILRAIFAPVIAVALLSLALIVVVMLQSYLQPTKNIEREETYIYSTTGGSSIGVHDSFNLTIDGNILGKQDGQTTKNFFSNLFLIIFTIFIVFGITQIISKFLSSGNVFGGKTIESTSRLSKQALGGLPLIPTPYGGVGMTNAKKFLSNDLPRRALGGKIQSDNTRTENFFRKAMGLQLKADPKLANDLKKLDQRFQETSRLGKSDFQEFQTLSAEFIQESGYTGQSTSIASIGAIAHPLEKFIKNLAEHQTDLSLLGFRSGKLTPRDGDKNIQEFISQNYTKQKDFFQAIYRNIGGDTNKLYSDGSNFWSKDIYRKGENTDS